MTLVVVSDLEQERFPEGLFTPEERGSISTFADQCGRRVALQTQQRLAEKDESAEPRPVKDYFVRGKIFHTLAEFYYGKPNRNVELAFDLPPEHEAARAEAYRLFGALKAILPQDFATSIECEVPMPADEMQKRVLNDFFGLSACPFKGVIDAVVEFDEDSASRFDKKFFRGVEQIVPGTYLFDWKTEGQTAREHIYALSHQRIAYQVAYELLYGVAPLGMIFARVVANKEPKVIMTYTPPPTHDEVQMCIEDFQRAEERILSERPNGFACYTKYSVCEFLTNGMCNRS